MTALNARTAAQFGTIPPVPASSLPFLGDVQKAVTVRRLKVSLHRLLTPIEAKEAKHLGYYVTGGVQLGGHTINWSGFEYEPGRGMVQVW